jgi:peptidoglycan/LPS O-acetylase OafA/YrhL
MDKQYVEPLTWLRALAAFFVVISHAVRASEFQYAPHDEASYFFPLSFLSLGTFGVYLFFALSGCTLFISNHEKIATLSDFWSFYVKRFMRIWPAFAVSLLVYLVFIEVFRAFYGADKSFWIAQFLKDYSLGNVIQYLSLTFNITGPRDLFVGPYWSLPVEFQYYLLFPVAVMLMRIKRLGFVAPIVLGGILYWLYIESVRHTYTHGLFYSNEIFRMGFVFFGGLLLAKCRQAVRYQVSFKWSIVTMAAIVLLAGLIKTNIVMVPESIPFISDKWNLYGILALATVFFALLTKPLTSRSKILDFIHSYGEVSYSIYLFHMLFVGMATLLVINLGIYGSGPKLLFILFFTLIGSYLFSIYTYRYIELPSIAMGRRLSKRRT